MEQLDKEVIEELSEPAKRVFRSLDYRSQRRMLKKATKDGVTAYGTPWDGKHRLSTNNPYH